MRWIDAVVLLNTAAMAVIVGLFVSAVKSHHGRKVHWAFLGILAGQFFWSMTDTLSAILAVQFQIMSNALGTASAIAVLLIAFSTYLFCEFFASPEALSIGRRIRIGSALVLTIACGALTFSSDFIGTRRVESGIRHGDYGPYFVIFGAWIAVLILWGIATLSVRSFREEDHRVRMQIRMFIFGAALNMVFAFAFSYVLPLLGIFDLDFAGPPSSVIFVSSVLYTILFQRFVNLKLAYGIAGIHVAVVGLSALLLGLLGAAVLAGTGWRPSVSVIVSAFVVFGAGIAYRSIVVPRVNEKIVGPPLDPAVTLTRLFSPPQTGAMLTRESALSAWVENAALCLKAKSAVLVVKLDRSLLYVSSAGASSQLSTLPDEIGRIMNRRPPMSILPVLDQAVSTEDGPSLFRSGIGRRYPRSSAILVDFFSRSGRAGFPVAIPLFRRLSFDAVLLLGPRQSGDLYYAKDLQLLSALRFPLSAALRRVIEQADLNESQIRRNTSAPRLSQFLRPSSRVDIDGKRQIIFRTEGMEQVIERARLFSEQHHPVLILGETGTGKELIARMLHNEGPRKGSPFVAVNCAAMPADLWEDEMFGHVRGAFTDARENREGRLLEAGEGTLFLDEVGELPPGMQSKLLRVLQERTFNALGSDKPKTVRCRFVFATNRDLAAMIQAKEFRDDLYYRISVFELNLPPLRDRLSDVPLIAERILEVHAQELGRPARSLDAEAVQELMQYSWPGNIRELENVILRAATTAGGGTISAADLGLAPRVLVRSAHAAKHVGAVTNYREAVDSVRRDLLRRALLEANGNKTKAAEALGLKRTTLASQLKELGME